MKKVFLLLSGCVFLAACGSGYQQDGPDQVKTPAAAATDTQTAALNPDSAANAKLAAVTRQPQVDTSATKIGTAPTGKPAGGKGAQLIAASDCASCHREAEKLIGPAYKDIAAKYPNTDANVATLAGKIISGGKGNWGDIPMTPHPGLAKNDAKEMVRYILSLK